LWGTRGEKKEGGIIWDGGRERVGIGKGGDVVK